MPAVVLALAEHGLYLRVKSRRTQIEIDKTGAGDFDFLQLLRLGDLLDDRRGEVARAAACGLRESHRDVGCKMAVRGIPRALDRALGCEAPCRVGEFGQTGQSVVEKFCYRGFH